MQKMTSIVESTRHVENAPTAAMMHYDALRCAGKKHHFHATKILNHHGFTRTLQLLRDGSLQDHLFKATSFPKQQSVKQDIFAEPYFAVKSAFDASMVACGQWLKSG